MPMHLLAMTRREFLRRCLAASSTLLLARRALAAERAGADPHCFALLSDTHIAADPSKADRGVNMAEHLRRVCQAVAELKPKPAGVIVNGDLAHNKGLESDYRQFAGGLRKLAAAGLPLHLLLGNHDHRDNFYGVLKSHRPAKLLVAGKHVAILESPRANWFLLDSLEATNTTPGLLGAKQLAWLAEALDARADKPAIVMAHHDPAFPQRAATQKKQAAKVTGLKDTQELLEVLAGRRHVKAYVYGHKHRWERSVREGLHLVGLPAVAYVFRKTDISGWVLVHLRDDGMTLDLRPVLEKHKDRAEKVELKWRS